MTPVSCVRRHLRGGPRGRLRAITTPRSRDPPPQTPQGSARSSAACRHWVLSGHSAHRALARSRSRGSSANHRSASVTWHGRSIRAVAARSAEIQDSRTHSTVMGFSTSARCRVCRPVNLDVAVVPNPLAGARVRMTERGPRVRLCDSPVARISLRISSGESVSVRGTHAARGLRLLLPTARRALPALLPDALSRDAVPMRRRDAPRRARPRPGLAKPDVHRQPGSRSGCDGCARRRRTPGSAWPQARR